MTAWRQLSASFEEFERLQSSFAQNSGQQDPNWRRNLIGLRRELQDSLIAIRAALQNLEGDQGHSAATLQLASALSSIRSAIALHQAEWPAVAIDTSDAGYRLAAKELRSATKAFRETARESIASLKTAPKR